MPSRPPSRPIAPATPSAPLPVFIGTAGWTLPKAHAHHFPPASDPGAHKRTHLQRCAAILPCAEVNSSFHRPHQPKIWQKWADSTPATFRFSVKIPKTITHTARLGNAGAPLQTFLQQVRHLGPKLGPLLVQLPPSLAFDEGITHEFLTTLRELHPAPETHADPSNLVALEPRHASWFHPAVDRLLREFHVARVAADPDKAAPGRASDPGGWPGLRYFRLHGQPRTYYSEYDEAFLAELATRLRQLERNAPRTPLWVIFDNTALGHATANALRLRELLAAPEEKPVAQTSNKPQSMHAKPKVRI